MNVCTHAINNGSHCTPRTMLTQKAFAKINLDFIVGAQRADGFHEIDSIVAFAPIGDQVGLRVWPDVCPDRPAHACEVKWGDNALQPNIHFGLQVPLDARNLVAKAGHLVAQALAHEMPHSHPALQVPETHLHSGWLSWQSRALKPESMARSDVSGPSDLMAHVWLGWWVQKNLPVGAGLGGGSADTAAAIRILRHFITDAFGTDAFGALSMPEPMKQDAWWHHIAQTIGSDVPVCMHQEACRTRGRGEIIVPLSIAQRAFISSHQAVLVWPAAALATLDVYDAYRAACETSDKPHVSAKQAANESNDDLDARFAQRTNHLIEVASNLCPAVRGAFGALVDHDCPSVGMSGSGSTVVGLWPQHDPRAHLAALRIQAEHPGWWVRYVATLF